MNNTNLTIATKDGVSKLIKPKFGPGMLLRAEDLDLLKDYTRDLNRLMFRSLFGCGVVCGLVVEVETDCGMVVVTVHSGLAIGCSGEPIYIPKDTTFPLHDDCDDVVVDEEVWVILCSKEKCCGPRTSVCASDDDDSPVECTREKDWWEVRVVSSPPECVCSCIEPQQTPNTTSNPNPNTAIVALDQQNTVDCKCATGPCYDDHYAGLCKCHCGDCSDCDCKCVLLARAKRVNDSDDWDVDHSVRRFVRPILMRDPQVEIEKAAALSTSTSQAHAISQSVNQAAFLAAYESVRIEAGKAAQKASQKVAQNIAKEIGERAANLVVNQVVDDVARQAARDAIAREVALAQETAAAAPTEPPPQTEEAGSKATSKTSKQVTKKSGLPDQ